MGLDSARGEIVAHRLCTAGAERDVVFARAALVGVSFNQENVLRISAQPLRLPLQRANRLLSKLRGISLEEHAVADIDDEILLAAWGRRARIRRRRAVGRILRACAD